MNRIRTTILFIILSFLFIAPLETFSGNKTKTIVIFFSLHANLPAYQNLLEGFHTTFSEEYHEPYNLLIEYLDIGRLEDDKYAKYIIEQYNEKFKDSNIDLLITVTPGIIPVLEKYGLNALKTSPTISIVLDSLRADQGLFKSENIVEIKVKFRFALTIQSACDLFPDCKNIYVISGCAPTDKYFASLTSAAARNFEKTHKIFFITGISLDSTLQIAGKIPEHSIIIVPTYLSDNKRIQFSGYANIHTSVHTLKKGAVNYLEKPFEEEEILQSVSEALELSRKNLADSEEIQNARQLKQKLTSKEQEVLTYLITGMLNKQIADKLNIVEHTVKIHKRSIYEKLGVRSVPEIIHIAYQAGILSAEKKP